MEGIFIKKLVVFLKTPTIINLKITNTDKLEVIKMSKKYKLVKDNSSSLYRIEAVRDFDDIKKGALGGLVEGEHNLSQEGNCWVYFDAQVYDTARVYGNAKIYGPSLVYEDSTVYGDAKVFGRARVFGNARVFQNAEVYGDARVCGGSTVIGFAHVYGNSLVTGKAKVYGSARIFDEAEVLGTVEVCGTAIINEKRQLDKIRFSKESDDYEEVNNQPVECESNSSFVVVTVEKEVPKPYRVSKVFALGIPLSTMVEWAREESGNSNLTCTDLIFSRFEGIANE